MWRSAKMWSFPICKLIIKDIKRPYPSGTLKNWRKCIEYLASLINMDPAVMYNTMTPGEYLNRFGIRDYYWDRIRGWPVCSFRSWPWRAWYADRADLDSRKGTPYEFINMPLPGTPAPAPKVVPVPAPAPSPRQMTCPACGCKSYQ